MSNNSVRKEEKPFSPKIFVVTVLLSLCVPFALLRLLFPTVWARQFQASFWSIILAFCVLHFCNAIVEHLFHRYFLHKRVFSWLGFLHRKHTKHHGLTRVRKKSVSGTDQKVRFVVENIYSITESAQHEASFFPWYSLIVFETIGSIFFIGIYCLWPHSPVFLGGFLAVAFSYSLYEVVHSIQHWPLERWNPYLSHPRWGWLWEKMYGYHLRHHADILSNENISGFFGLPVGDWIFGTYVKFQTLYTHGEEVDERSFETKRPNCLLRWLDKLVEA